MKGKKENIKTFIIILIIGLILCGGFLKFHKTTDTYWNIGLGYTQYKQYPLQDGRIVNYCMLSIGEFLNMPFEIYAVLMNVANLILLCFSTYYVYKHIVEKKDVEDNKKSLIIKIIILLGSILIVFNPMAVEVFAYVEIVIPLSILLFTKASIILDKGNKHAFLKSTILVIFACLCYQATINIFIILLILFCALDEKKSIKEWSIHIAKIIAICLIALAIMLLILTITNYVIGTEQTRLGNEEYDIITIIGKMLHLATLVIFYTFEFCSRYIIFIIIWISIFFILIITKEPKKILKYLFIIVVAIFSCVIPVVLQKEFIISARMAMPIGAIIGISIIYLLFQNRENKKWVNIAISAIGSILLIINIYNYINLVTMNSKTEECEKIYCLKISDCIEKYENETGNTIQKVAFIMDAECSFSFENMPINTFTTKGITADYSNVHCLNYYIRRNLEKVSMDKEIYIEYFYKKNWNDFDEEQIKFKNDTVYICIY